MTEVLTRNLRLIAEEPCLGEEEKGYPPSQTYRILHRETGSQIGHITIRIGNDEILNQYSGHISYGVDEAYRGNRYAAEACRAVLPIAQSLGIKPIRITCDPDNAASRRTCDIAGGVYLGEVVVPPGNYVYENGGRKKSQYDFALET